MREPDFGHDWRKKEIFERAHMTLVRRIPLLVLAVFISLSTAFGQTSGSIRGTVQDPPGAIVAGANTGYNEYRISCGGANLNDRKIALFK